MGGGSGKHVGTVDHLDGEAYVKLTKDDSADGQHRWIPTNWVEKTDDKANYLNKTQEEFKAQVSKSFPGEMLKKAI